MATFQIKRNDQLPEIVATCLDAAGAAVDLTSATGVTFHMAASPGGAVKVNAAGVIVTPSAGIVKYVWTTPDTDTSGTYNAEFQVNFASPTRAETFPNNGHITVTITDDLA